MKETRVPSDTVKAIFHYLGEYPSGTIRFPANVSRLHEVFYDLSQNGKFERLFEDFIFDTSRMFPYSLTIRYALDRLQKSNLLECINPGLDEFAISEALVNWDLEKTKLFDSKEIVLLKEAAKEFEKLVKAISENAL